MTPKPNDTSESLRLLQKAGLENAELRERGARLEFQAMQYELASGQAFTLNVEFPSRKPVPAPSVSNISAVTRALAENPHLPALDIPLGRIAFSRVAETLPVIAMLCPDIDSKSLAAYFLDMLEEHHRKPFAKLLFVCETLTPIPFLGRYGFAYHYLGRQRLDDSVDILVAKYAITQVRLLTTGQKIWPLD